LNLFLLLLKETPILSRMLIHQMLLQAAEIKEFLSTFLDGASMFLSLFLDLFLLTWSL